MLALCFGGSRATVFLPKQDYSIARVWCKHGLHRGKAAAWLPHSKTLQDKDIIELHM